MRTLRKRARGCAAVAALAMLSLFALNAEAAEVLPGVEVLARELAGELAGKRVGILTNQTGVDRELNSTIDIVRALPEVNVVRLFSPEHGIRGGIAAGAKVDDTVDPISGLPVVSLYGSSRRPKADHLRDLDVVLYDIQDVGSRSYTYVSTLTYLMEVAEETGTAVWVLDRPEPMGGTTVGGPMIEDELKSFIGVHDVPQVYGMTPGEWARMIRAERTPGVELRVVPMRGWRRGMTYGELGWPWVPPSPHIPDWETSFFYAMTGIIGELGRLNEGVGTAMPFELMGAPWLDGRALAQKFNAAGLAGVKARPVSFIPRYGTFSGQECSGIQLHLDYGALGEIDPARAGLTLMKLLNEVAPGQRIFFEAAAQRGDATMFLKALGDRELGAALAKAEEVSALEAKIEAGLEAFRERRANYLIYE